MLVYKRCLTAICLLACCATLRAHGGHGVSGPSASHGSHHHSTQDDRSVMRLVESGLSFLDGADEVYVSPQSQYSDSTGAPHIPKIIHHVYLDGEEEYDRAVAAAEEQGKGLKRGWRESCVSNHSSWKYMFWDMKAATNLLETRYPWYLQFFNDYEKRVSQGDALRPFLMHAFGGLYLDLDMQCYKPMDDSLSEFDIILQEEGTYGGDDQIVNSMVASVPDHPFWKGIIRSQIQARSKIETVADAVEKITQSTGPALWQTYFESYARDAISNRPYAGSHRVKGTNFRIYKHGEGFIPCKVFDLDCHNSIDESAASGSLPAGVVGHHHYTATWW